MINVLLVGLYRGKGASGGVANYINLLLANIDKINFRISYFSLGKSPNWYHGKDRISKYQYWLSHFFNIFSFLKCLRFSKIEVVHINSGLTRKSLFRDGIFAILSKISGCKVFFFIHGWKVNEFNKIINNYFLKIFFVNLLNKQDRISVLSNSFRQDLHALGVDFKKICVTLPMVETVNYIPKSKKHKDPFKVLFCANMVKEKGPFILLDSIPYILKRYPKTIFIFVGNGDDFMDLRQQTRKKGLDANVVFSGYIPMNLKTKLFQLSDVFVFPTFYGEGLPVVLLEAMASQMAVISTPQAGISDVIENYKQGFLLSSINPDSDEIANKIINLFEDPVLINNIGENNIRKAIEEYDVSIVSTQISKIYKEILVN